MKDLVRRVLLSCRALPAAPDGRQPYAESASAHGGHLQQALALRQSVAVADSSNPFVSLMAHGVRKAGRIWLSICLAIVENLYFWRLVDETNQKSATIADALVEIVRDRQNRGRTVCSLITDNASNEYAALNPAIATSVQRRKGVAVIRTPCLSRTTNLAVGSS
jgi:hypothetical protein